MTLSLRSSQSPSRGRPRKAARALRDQHIGLRVTMDEHAQLRTLAASRGISLSEFLLTRVLAPASPPSPANDDAPAPAGQAGAADPLFELTRQLRSVGVNLNQIARHTNATGRLSTAMLAPELKQLASIIAAIDQQLERLL